VNGDAQRPTPANPMPGTRADAGIPRSDTRNLPPELGPDAVAVLDGRTFMYSDPTGDVPSGSIGGLVNADTRPLDRCGLGGPAGVPVGAD
jgi:hypothetical protein